jgi:protein-S-isoprenylcysteine O-methyltransferase Ste14
VTPTSAAIAIVLATVAYGALHSALASLPAKQAARRLFGPSADRIYRLSYNVVGAITLLPLLAFTAWQPGLPLYTVSPPLLYLFLAGQAAALVIIGLGLLQTGPAHFIGFRQLMTTSEEPPRLTTGGLYRFVRHPLYSAGFVFLWLTPVMTSTLMALYAGLSLYLYIGSLFEERRLLREFGAPYKAYQRQVPRLVPRRPGRRSPATGSNAPSA